MHLKTLPICLLLWSMLSNMFFCSTSYAQQDRYDQLLKEKKKICETTMATFSGKPESLDLLINTGSAGLKLTRPDDHGYKFLFNQAIGNGFYYKQDFKQAKDHFEQAYSEALKAGLLEKSLKSLGNLIAIYHYLGMQGKADDAAQKLKLLAEATDTLKNKSDIYYNLGLYNQQQKFYYGIALSYFLKSAALHKHIADTVKAVKSKLDYGVKLMMVSEIYIYLKQPHKALQYLNEVNPYLGQSIIFDITAYGKFIRAAVLLNDRKVALKYYNLLYSVSGKVHGKWSELVSSSLEIAALALKDKDYPLAKSYIDRADQQAKLDSNEMLTSAVNLSYGDYYKSIGNYLLAVKYYKASEHGTAIYDKERYVDLLKSLTAVTIMLGGKAGAQNYFSKYVTVSDSLNQEKVSLNLAEMEARFQNEYKQQKIGLLNKENEAKNMELLQERNARWLLIGGALLLLVALVLIYVNYRSKQKANLLLDKKNKQLDVINEELFVANQTKAKLFGIISHDLRSPVSQLFTFLKLQQTKPGFVNEESEKVHQKGLMQSSSNLLATMEDLLLWSKSQMDHFELDNEEVDVEHLLMEVLKLLRDQAEGKKMKLEIGKLDYQFVNSDYNLLFTILRNLLQNAVNHSFSETVISIHANINAEKQQYISILNHGEIIPAERIKELINDVHVNSKSSGYGLLIVKELTGMIGAKLNIFSTKEGTTTQVVFS
ncbi:Signal transduction histidine kinase [Pedobacter sp. ok626]|uniref:tetratricopeptide repeat-containing sensor histidine kinase n=1 Tax=Pedobacter sp. ok626 TaxID=1761882 RepID=UPI000880A223|nr:HAMP domain-containing sensor histidine kinase [Pedobacter sp. ok626]SDL75875.1 Signal transduction histidine kinase [Pedobacter sp. ok626]